MKNSKQQRILETYDMFEEMEPDISTERLIAMVCDYVGCDASDVAEALVMDRQEADGKGGW